MKKIAIEWTEYGPEDHDVVRTHMPNMYAVGCMAPVEHRGIFEDLNTVQVYDVTDDGYLIAGWDDPFPYILVMEEQVSTERDIKEAVAAAFPGFLTDEDVNGADLVDFITDLLFHEE